MDCPKCKSSHHVKDGIVNGRQRYKCKDCLYRFTVVRKSDVKTPDTKRLAFELYLEGAGFRSIGRFLKISYGTVYVWVNKWRSKMSIPRRESSIEQVELEKLLAYILSQKSANHYGLLLIDLKNNVSFLSTEATLADNIKNSD